MHLRIDYRFTFAVFVRMLVTIAFWVLLGAWLAGAPVGALLLATAFGFVALSVATRQDVKASADDGSLR